MTTEIVYANGKIATLPRGIWPHHIICSAPASKTYTFKIWENSLWSSNTPYELSLQVDGAIISGGFDDGRLEMSPFKIETDQDVDYWIKEHNRFHSLWEPSNKGCVKRTTPYLPVVRPMTIRKKSLFCVVAQLPQHKKLWNGIPDGYFFYPKDRESRAECEAIIEELKRDMEALT